MTTPMNQDIKARWTARLRDPATKQAHGGLKVDAGNCCLGVLCDIYIEEHETEGWEPDDILKYYSFQTYSAFLPPLVSAWASLDFSGDPEVSYNDESTYLSALNDGNKLPFSEIADIIDAQL